VTAQSLLPQGKIVQEAPELDRASVGVPCKQVADRVTFVCVRRFECHIEQGFVHRIHVALIGQRDVSTPAMSALQSCWKPINRF
jgi:hypothetical protein